MQATSAYFVVGAGHCLFYLRECVFYKERQGSLSSINLRMLDELTLALIQPLVSSCHLTDTKHGTISPLSLLRMRISIFSPFGASDRVDVWI